MARFRRSGFNWEGRAWTVSPSLGALLDEVEDFYPVGHRTDGTVASKAHDQNNPLSDHRPYPYTGPGVVNAVDAGEVVENDAFNIAEAIRRTQDSRTLYVIHESRLFSSYVSSSGIPPWTWRTYSGPAPHSDHVHVSVRRENQGNGAPWRLALGDDMASPGQKLIVDLAFNLFPDEVQGDANYWYAKDEHDPEWDSDFRPALSRGAQNLYTRSKTGNGLTETQVKALIADSRIVPR